MPSPIQSVIAATSAMWAVTWAQPTPYVLYGHPAEPSGTNYLFMDISVSAPAGGPSNGTGPWAVGSPVANAQSTPVSATWAGAVTDGSYVYTVEADFGTGCALVGTIGGGTVTSWGISGNCTGVDLNNFPMVEDGGFLFTLGGRSGTAIIADVFRTQVTGSGTVGAWSSIGQLPFGIRRAPHQAAVVTVGGQSRVYFVGGFDNTTTLSSVFLATLTNGALGAWSSVPALPAPREYGTLVSYQASGNFYLAFLGGRDGVNEVSDTYYTQINASTGALGSWTTTSPLPGPRQMHAAVVF